MISASALGRIVYSIQPPFSKLEIRRRMTTLNKNDVIYRYRATMIRYNVMFYYSSGKTVYLRIDNE